MMADSKPGCEENEWAEVYTGDGRCYLLHSKTGEKRWVEPTKISSMNDVFTLESQSSAPSSWEEWDDARLNASEVKDHQQGSESSAKQVATDTQASELPMKNKLRSGVSGLGRAIRGGRSNRRGLVDRTLRRRHSVRSLVVENTATISRSSSVVSTRSQRPVSTCNDLDGCDLESLVEDSDTVGEELFHNVEIATDASEGVGTAHVFEDASVADSCAEKGLDCTNSDEHIQEPKQDEPVKCQVESEGTHKGFLQCGGMEDVVVEGSEKQVFVSVESQKAKKQAYHSVESQKAKKQAYHSVESQKAEKQSYHSVESQKAKKQAYHSVENQKAEKQSYHSVDNQDGPPPVPDTLEDYRLNTNKSTATDSTRDSTLKNENEACDEMQVIEQKHDTCSQNDLSPSESGEAEPERPNTRSYSPRRFFMDAYSTITSQFGTSNQSIQEECTLTSNISDETTQTNNVKNKNETPSQEPGRITSSDDLKVPTSTSEPKLETTLSAPRPHKVSDERLESPTNQAKTAQSSAKPNSDSQQQSTSRSNRRGKRGNSRRNRKQKAKTSTTQLAQHEANLTSHLSLSFAPPFKVPTISRQQMREKFAASLQPIKSLKARLWNSEHSITSILRIVLEFILVVVVVSTLTPSEQAPIVQADSFFRTVVAGEKVTIAVTVKAVPLPKVQWRLNGVDIPGANSPTHVISEVNKAHSGTYTCLVSNTVGQTVWEEAFLNVVEDLYQAPDGDPTDSYAARILAADEVSAVNEFALDGGRSDRGGRAERVSYWRDLVESMATHNRSWEDSRTLRARNCLLEKAPHAVRASAMKDGGASVVAAGEHAGYLSCFYGVARATAEPELHELMVNLLERLRSLHGLSYHPHRLVNVVTKLDEIATDLFKVDRADSEQHLLRIATALSYEAGLYSSGIPENVSRAKLLPEAISSLIAKGASIPPNTYNADEL